MRTAALLAVAALFLSCTSVQTRVRGELLIYQPAADGVPQKYAYEAVEPHPVGGFSLGCLFTAVVYGGVCWMYLAMPFASQQVAALERAHDDAARIGRCAVLVGARVDRAGWDDAPRAIRVRDSSARELSAEEIEGLCRAYVDPTPPP